MTNKEVLKMAEGCAQKLGVTKGTWYVVDAVPSAAEVPKGHFLMIPNDHGDSVILIDINTCESHFVHMSKYQDMKMLGVVRQGKADEKIWV